MSNGKRIIAAGHVCIDITPGFHGNKVSDIGELLRPGKLIETGAVTISSGGAVANTGLALKVLGEDVVLMGKIGDDILGDTLSDILMRYGVKDGMIRAAGEETSYSVVLAIPGIDRVFLHNPGANHTFRADDIPEEALDKATLFHFGYPPLMKSMYQDDGTELVNVMSKAKDAGCITSLDMAMADPDSEAGSADWKAILKKVLPLTDIFAPSIEELFFMLDREKYEKYKSNASNEDITGILDLEKDIKPLADKCIEFGTKILFLKCGVPGLFLKTSGNGSLKEISNKIGLDPDKWAEREIFERSYVPDKVVSASGAGDTSIAAFLSSFLGGETPEESLRLAAATGALCVAQYDAISGILPLSEIKKRIRSGWSKIDR